LNNSISFLEAYLSFLYRIGVGHYQTKEQRFCYLNVRWWNQWRRSTQACALRL